MFFRQVAADEKGRMTITSFPVSYKEAGGGSSGASSGAAAAASTVHRPFIRANQGHSVKITGELDEEKLLTRVHDPAEIPVCIHGTNLKSWPRSDLVRRALTWLSEIMCSVFGDPFVRGNRASFTHGFSLIFQMVDHHNTSRSHVSVFRGLCANVAQTECQRHRNNP